MDRSFLWILLWCFVVILIACLLSGCTNTAERYQPHQQFDRSGPCTNGNCPVINTPKQWLKPCP